MSGPKRIQMSRQRPWRAEHPDAVIVARPSKWGNPFRLNDRTYGLVRYGPEHATRFGREWDYEGRISAPNQSHHMHMPGGDVVAAYVRWATAAEVVELFRLTVTKPTPGMRMAYPSAAGRFVSFDDADLAELRGRDLACWCPLDQPCHADVLLELANVDDDRGSVTLAALSPLISAVALVVVWFMANHTETARSLFLLGLVFVALVGLVLRPLAKALLRCADRLDLEDWTARRLVEAGQR